MDTRKANSNEVREGADVQVAHQVVLQSWSWFKGRTRAGKDAVKEAAMFLTRCRSCRARRA